MLMWFCRIFQQTTAFIHSVLSLAHRTECETSYRDISFFAYTQKGLDCMVIAPFEFRASNWNVKMLILYWILLLFQSKPPREPREQRPRRSEPNRPERDSSRSGAGGEPNDDFRRASRYPDSHQLFVGNLPHTVGDKELKEQFEGMWSMKCVLNVLFDKQMNPSPGHIFCPKWFMIPIDEMLLKVLGFIHGTVCIVSLMALARTQFRLISLNYLWIIIRYEKSILKLIIRSYFHSIWQGRRGTHQPQEQPRCTQLRLCGLRQSRRCVESACCQGTIT